jgi:DNA-binding CsgD family transcriptional regulator
VTFVGRAPQLRQLDERLRSALAGQGQAVLVAGEPGVGKTRLAEEAAGRAGALGLAVAAGRAVEDEGSPPYWPFLQALHELGLPPPDRMAGSTVLSGESADQRFGLFQSATDALVAAAAPAGLCLILDDLHWADPGSLRLLVHLAMSVRRSRLVVLATYRDTETAGQEPLRAAVAALTREAAVTRIRLTGLSELEVAARLRDVVGWEVPATVAAAVCRRTQGNPFFVGELGRVLVSSVDGQLPDGVRDAVRDRLGRVSRSCRELVAAAAVLGSEVDPSALADAAGHPLDEVLTAFDEATAAGILALAGRRFAHDLIRECARLELPTPERLRLHERMAEHLTGRADADVRISEIAHHRLESLPAGEAEPAIAAALRAGEQAMARCAWEGAATWYRRALAAASAHAPVDPDRRGRLLLALAEAEVRSLALAEAREALVEAARIARGRGDAETIARAVLVLEGHSDHLWETVEQQLCAEALAGLSEEDSALRARLLALQVASSIWTGEDAERRSAQALAMAERVGDRHTIREALRSRQMARSGPDGAAERIALGDRMLALGLAEDTVLWGRLWRFDGLTQLGELDRAEAELGPIAAEAERLRTPVAAWHLVRCRAAMAGARGRFDEAMACALEAERLARRAGTGGPLVPSQAMLLLYRIRLGDPGEYPAEHGQVSASPGANMFLSTTRALWQLATGDREGAARTYRTWSDAVPPMVLLPALARMIEFAVEFDDPDRAARCYERLLPYRDLLVCGGAGVVAVVGTVREALGLAAGLTGRLEDAVRHLRAGIELATRIGLPPALASSTYQLAVVLARRRRPGDREEAAALATSAAAMAERMGLRPLAERARALSGSRPDPGPLTKREREIALLVSQGLTSRQIAAAVHISERTVETHVRHIMEKLGFANRAQIAAWVASGG